MKKIKALILAAGRGKRFGKVSEGINKCMSEIGNLPLIEYSLRCLKCLPQITQIIVVVGYKAKDLMKRYGSEYGGKEIIYVTQKERGGLVHAIECAKSAIGASDFMLMLGDEFMIKARHKEFIEEFEKEDAFVLCGVVSVKDENLIKKTYAIIKLEDGRIARLIEKPAYPIFNNLMGTGNCIFRNEIFDYIPKTPINQKRLEKELPDLIQCVIDEGRAVKPFIICKEYINVNYPEELDKTKSYFAHV